MQLLLLVLPPLLCAATGMWEQPLLEVGRAVDRLLGGGEGVSWATVSQALGAEPSTRTVMPAESRAACRRNAGFKECFLCSC